MPQHISLIVDKSVLQSLSAQEAKWLFHHFRVNFPPVLFAEVLADLAKSKPKGLAAGTGKGDVRMLASKITSHAVHLNAAHYDLVAGELMGYPVEMSRRPILGNAKVARMPDGSFGALIDQGPFQTVMDRWCAGDFDGMEREFAKNWRDDLKLIDLEQLLKETRHLRANDMRTLESVGKRAYDFLFGSGRDYAHLDNLMQMASAKPSHRASALRRWNSSGRPAPKSFIPYTAFIAWLETVFVLGLHAGVITTRATNRIDIEYFKYLPFTNVFSSGDHLHERLFPMFAHPRQIFLPSSELKASLRDMEEYYAALTEE